MRYATETTGIGPVRKDAMNYTYETYNAKKDFYDDDRFDALWMKKLQAESARVEAERRAAMSQVRAGPCWFFGCRSKAVNGECEAHALDPHTPEPVVIVSERFLGENIERRRRG